MPASFVDLSPAGQVRRLRGLAEAALPRFGLGGAELVPYGHGENTVFRAEVSGRRFAVRIHGPNYHTANEIRSELAWLAALVDTGIPGPEPLFADDGGHTVELGGEEVYAPRQVSVLRWLPGRLIGRRRAPLTYRKLGHLMADLHEHAAAWERPGWFERPTWDQDALFGEAVDYGGGSAATAWAHVQPSMEPVWREAESRAAAAIEALGRGAEVFGLIHADLHTHNVMQHQGSLLPFDFDDCGLGWLLYDLSVPLDTFRFTPKWAPMRDAFLEGYAEVRTPPDLTHLDAFIGARLVTTGLWVLGMAEINQGFEAWTGEFLEEVTADLRRLHAGD